MTPTTRTKTTTQSPHAFNPAVTTRRNPLRNRTANLTAETFVLAAALLAFSALVLAAPQIALLLFGVPAAAVLGITTLAGIARYLGR